MSSRHPRAQVAPENQATLPQNPKDPALKLAWIETQAEDLAIALRVTGAPLRVAQAALEGHIDIDPIDLAHLLGAVLENLNASEKSAGDLALAIGRHLKAVGGEA